MRLLRALVALDAERHFGRAARRLHLSQPALSRQIARLERQVGTPLFSRTSRSVTPTPAGRRLARRAAAALEAIDAAVEEARAGDVRPTTVHLGIAETVDDSLVARLHAMLATDGSHRLAVHPGWSSDLVDALCRGSLDLVVGHALLVPDDVETEVLALDALAARLADGHPLASTGGSVALPDLAGATLLVPPRALAPGAHDHLIACCRASGFEPQVATPSVATPPSIDSVPTALDAGSFTLVPEPLPVQPGAVARALRDAPLIALMVVCSADADRDEVQPVVDALRRAAGSSRRLTAVER